ncbi:kinase-like protein [Cryphonectria parasitica EP155]|uniref:non-specific serine/threonine protein kinase n=1 Tax=Cryphonectria parasitica (strain ATCC 38755 / EP155) TaxID=660469 RepID=A0A9P4Y645_CRYP1|nr:kinase-like protein [Cryphonectria parasitica EP155]KAF3767186.1 kinase-like protein [Cryphonectria parasitica EP155]
MSSSSDEGEIRENGVEDSKASTLPRVDGNGVDRQDRRARPARSPDRAEHQSRRPRSPRGYKRSRDDDADSYRRGGRRGGPDPRRFRVHYEDAPSPRDRHAYEDPDRPVSRGTYDDHLDRPSNQRFRDSRDYPSSNSRYDDRDRDYGRSEKRTRTRSPSPSRGGRSNGKGRPNRNRWDAEGAARSYQGQQAASIKYSSQTAKQVRDDTANRRPPAAEARDFSKDVAKSDQANTSNSDSPSTSKKTTEEPDHDWEEPKPLDEEAEIERRRRRREALLRKSRASTPLLVQAVQANKNDSKSEPLSVITSPQRTPQTPVSESLDIANDGDLINHHAKAKAAEENGPSAADYDPTVDMREDERRDEMRNGVVGLHGEDRRESLTSNGQDKDEPMETTEASKAEDDDDFDMFAEDFDEEKLAAPKSAPKAKAPTEDPVALQGNKAGGILEDDDKDGYYKLRPSEIVNGRYQIQSSLGKGMFSGVARATDITTRKLVAIKIMRNNDALKKGGFTEIAILQKLNSADPDNRKHIVKFERSFEHKGHLCMAFENLSLNLREVLKKFGNNVGINLVATKAYAHQIFLALGHMRKCSIIHADLKPDNILVNEQRNVLKICDLGTAIDRSDAATAHNEVTPYLVSRFYRAPEIILGMPYDYAIDMWSIGCTLYELYTGKILFTGDSNNQMLRAIIEIRGKMSTKLYRRGSLWTMHFDEMGNFISQERDKILGKTTVRILPVVKPTRDLRTRLMAASSGMDEAEARHLNHFYDLLDRCLAVNPDKRITPSEALRHPFFQEKIGTAEMRAKI